MRRLGSSTQAVLITFIVITSPGLSFRSSHLKCSPTSSLVDQYPPRLKLRSRSHCGTLPAPVREARRRTQVVMAVQYAAQTRRLREQASCGFRNASKAIMFLLKGRSDSGLTYSVLSLKPGSNQVAEKVYPIDGGIKRVGLNRGAAHKPRLCGL